MKTLKLKKINHSFKMGDKPLSKEPNVTESCFLVDENGSPVGAYIREMPEKMQKLLQFVNYEFKSDRVPKSNMTRMPKEQAEARGLALVEQYSTIIGGVPPKGQFKRHYSNVSSVHRSKTAKPFLKGMLVLEKEVEKFLADLLPEIYDQQKKVIADSTPEKFRLGDLFTSAICNYGIAASYHTDHANLKHTVNAILTRRMNATGGNLDVPDFDLTFDQCDYSMLIYPAWANMHGVTPIIPTKANGYRNSFIFYPIAGLK